MTEPNLIRKVLIVDDNKDIHADFKKILLKSDLSKDNVTDLEVELFGNDESCQTQEKVFFEVESAYQGQEAYEMIKKTSNENRFMLAFVDMRMPPGWDGLETIKKIFTIDSTIQIVICTAFSDYSWDAIHKAIGLNDRLLILKKPFDAIEVVQFASALCEKWILAKYANLKLEELEELVKLRTDELVILNKELEKIAITDPLTGIYNRRYFIENYEKEFLRAKRHSHNLSTIMIDLDKFKNFNDNYGHIAGDSLLKDIASILRDTIRSTDFVSRLGGEEFIIVLPETPKQGALELSDRLRKKIENHKIALIDKSAINITISLGIATFPIDSQDADTLLEKADKALYEAKKLGRNRIFTWE